MGAFKITTNGITTSDMPQIWNLNWIEKFETRIPKPKPKPSHTLPPIAKAKQTMSTFKFISFVVQRLRF